jgi:DNA-directed RNA polymerase subunit beta'
MQLAKHFIQTNVEPEWMVLCLLPVLPPELRPIVYSYRSGDKVASDFPDINQLYKRVIRRNNNLAYLLCSIGSKIFCVSIIILLHQVNICVR